MYLGVVHNPRAGKNRKRPGAEARLRALVGDAGEVVMTDRLEALDEVVRELLPRVTHLVSDGGDGALHHLINAVRAIDGDEAAAEWPVFVPTRGGTIDFVPRKVGLVGRPEEVVERLVGSARAGVAPSVVELDTLRLEGPTGAGQVDALGFALAAAGVGNNFFDHYYARTSPTPATIVAIIADVLASQVAGALPFGPARRGEAAARFFAPIEARVSIDGSPLPMSAFRALHAGAFDVDLGGIIRLFPSAREAGMLHLQAGDLRPTRAVAHLPSLFRGLPLDEPTLYDGPGRELVVEPAVPLRPIVDGERYEGLRSLRVTLGPKVRIGVPGL